LNKEISLIGAGAMGGTIIERLISAGFVRADAVLACDGSFLSSFRASSGGASNATSTDWTLLAVLLSFSGVSIAAILS